MAKHPRPANDKVLPKVRALAESIADPLGARVVGVDFVLEGTHRYLRVTVAEPGSTRIGTCEKVSRALSKELDALDLIPDEYFLEVSSPGVTVDALLDEEPAAASDRRPKHPVKDATTPPPGEEESL